MNKQYIIQAMSFDECGKSRTRYLMSHTKGLRERITRTRWVENARGFNTMDEAMEYAEKLSHGFYRLTFTVVNRSLVGA
jgi:hypothetical protein